MNKTTILCAAALALTVSCSDETTVFSDPHDDIQLESSEQVLNNSVVYLNAGVLDISESDNITGKYAKAGVDGVCRGLPFNTGSTNQSAFQFNCVPCECS